MNYCATATQKPHTPNDGLRDEHTPGTLTNERGLLNDKLLTGSQDENEEGLRTKTKRSQDEAKRVSGETSRGF